MRKVKIKKQNAQKSVSWEEHLSLSNCLEATQLDNKIKIEKNKINIDNL